MKVIGAIGLNGSGKDELVDYLHEQYDVPRLSLGDIVRDIAEKEGIRPTRDNLHDISEIYFARHGRDYFARKLVDQIRDRDTQVVAVTGVRSPADVGTLKEEFGDDFVLVHVQVGDPALRFARTQQRDKARDPGTLEAFLEQDREEREIFEIDEAVKEADLSIRNDRSLEKFYERIDECVAGPILGQAREEGANCFFDNDQAGYAAQNALELQAMMQD
jgi:dephospho-CoA kinase